MFITSQFNSAKSVVQSLTASQHFHISLRAGLLLTGHFCQAPTCLLAFKHKFFCLVYGHGHIKASISSKIQELIRSVTNVHTVNRSQSLPLTVQSNWVPFTLLGKKNPPMVLNIETSLVPKKYSTCKLVGAGEYFREVSLDICTDLILSVSQLSKNRLLTSMGIGPIVVWLFHTHCHSPSTSGKEVKKMQVWLCALPTYHLHLRLYQMKIQYNPSGQTTCWLYSIYKQQAEYQIGKIQLKIKGRTKHHLTFMQLTTQFQTPRYEMLG